MAISTDNIEEDIDEDQETIYDLADRLSEGDETETEETEGTDEENGAEETAEEDETEPEQTDWIMIASGLSRDEVLDPARECLDAVVDRGLGDLSESYRASFCDYIADGTVDYPYCGTVDDNAVVLAKRPDRDGVIDGLGWAADHSNHYETVTIVVDKIETIGADLWEIQDRLSVVLGEGATVVLVQEGITLTTGSEAAEACLDLLLGLARAGTELERETGVADLRDNGVDPTHTGRPPIGFTVVDGELRPGDDYEQIRAELTRVRAGEISQSEAARRLSTSRKTVRKCLDRPELYGLDG